MQSENKLLLEHSLYLLSKTECGHNFNAENITRFSFYKNYVCKNVRAWIYLKFRNIVVNILLVAIFISFKVFYFDKMFL